MIDPPLLPVLKSSGVRVFLADNFSLSHLGTDSRHLQTSSEITHWYLYRFGSYTGYGFAENYLTSRIYKIVSEVTDLRKTKIYKGFKARPLSGTALANSESAGKIEWVLRKFLSSETQVLRKA